MSVAVLGVAYIGLGAAIAAALVLAGRLGTRDAILVAVLWPVYAPACLLGDHRGEHRLLDALRRARRSPLAAMLPDDAVARRLARRVHEATARLAEFDAMLAHPDFAAEAAARRAQELADRGAVAAATTAQLRVRTLGQLRALRERYRAELDDVGELIAQLVTQAELLRLDAEVPAASVELVSELVARVEGLGDLLAEQPRGEYPSLPGRSG